MQLTRFAWFIATALLLVVSACNQKSSSPEPSPNPGANRNPASGTADTTIARIHWLGKTRLNAEANATNFMSIWNMPESAALENQTLNKLALAPWRLTKGDAATNGAPTAELRALLDDLVQAESYLELRQPATNQPVEAVLAVQLTDERHALWKTNLAAALESLIGIKTTQETGGWTLQKSDAPNLMQFSRVGDWTLVSLANRQNSLLAEFKSRIGRDRAPFTPRATNYWLETDVDLARFSDTFNLGWKFPAGLPRIKLTQIGDGKNVRTRGELLFPRPLDLELEPWNVPTNLIHDPLIGFSAVRGFRPLLKSLGWWDEARFDTAPNEAFFWAQDGTGPFEFVALPTRNPSNHLYKMSDFALEHVNPRFAFMSPFNEMRYGVFERRGSSNQALRWKGVPYVTPYLTLLPDSNQDFLYGGLFPNLNTNRPMPLALLGQVQNSEGLVYYHWEATRPKVGRWIQVSQFLRLVLGAPRLTLSVNASLPFLVAISSKLDSSGTAIRHVNPNEVILIRSSTIGLTGVELHLLSDWFESPTFPKGLLITLADTNFVRSVWGTTTNHPASN